MGRKSSLEQRQSKIRSKPVGFLCGFGLGAGSYTHLFRIFLSFGAVQVCVSFADSHFVDGFQYIAKGLVMAHQCIASRNQDIPELSVVLEIFHQFSQPLVPALFRFQFLEVEVQTLSLIHISFLISSWVALLSTPNTL